MLTLFISWVFLAVISLIVGVVVIPTKGTEMIDPVDRLVVCVWSGLLLIALVLFSTACYLPLRPVGVLTGLTLGGALLLLSGRGRYRTRSLFIQLRRDYWTTSNKLTICLLTLLPAILLGLYCSQQVTYFDTGLYHYQMVALLREYGVLKGAAHIHDRFGFNSSWFALATGFYPQTINGFVVLLSGVHLLILLRRIYVATIAKCSPGSTACRTEAYAVISYLLILPYLLFANGLANSLSPDLPVCLLLVVITWWMLLTSNCRPQRITVLIFGLTLFSIKLNAIALSAVCVINYITGDHRRLKTWVVAFGLGVLITTPLLLVNTYSSGCPLYPSSFGCLEQLPWARSAAQAEELRTVISLYARTEGQGGGHAEGLAGVLLWVVDGYSGTLRNVSLLTIISFASVLILIGWGRTMLMEDGRLMVMVIGVIGSIYVLILAPRLRVSIGYLAIAPALLISLNWLRGSVLVPCISSALLLLTPFTELEYWRQRLLLLLLLLVVYLAVLTTSRLQQPRVFFLILLTSLVSPLLSVIPSRINVITPAPITRPDDADLELVEARGFSYFLTHSGRLKNECWGAPIPCTPYRPEERLQVIDPRIGLSSGVMPVHRSEK